MPRKMASVKKANPSSENGMPMMGPAKAMKRGQSSPSSNEMTVPETAPTAKRMAVPFAHRRASSRYTSSPPRRQRHSASTMKSGMATPTAAKTMWKASEVPKSQRAARRSVTEGSPRDDDDGRIEPARPGDDGELVL